MLDMKGGGTGFLGITTKRIIVYDKAFLRKMKAVVSIPYSRVQTIAAEDESGLLTSSGFFSSSKLIITTSHDEARLRIPWGRQGAPRRPADPGAPPAVMDI